MPKCLCCGESLWKRALCPECEEWAYKTIWRFFHTIATANTCEFYEEHISERVYSQ